MRISQISLANTDMYSKRSYAAKQPNCRPYNAAFKGGLSDKIADGVVKFSMGVGIAILYPFSKIFADKEENKQSEEPQGRDVYGDNYDRWGMGDPTL